MSSGPDGGPSDLTIFPKLQASYSSATVLTGGDVSKDLAVLSWAILLRGYVPKEVVAFEVDGDLACVDFDAGTVEITKLTNSFVGGSAIYFDSFPMSPNNSPPIYLHRDQKNHTLSIAASQKLLPATFLPTLCNQLSSIIKANPTYPTAYSPLFTTGTQEVLSILNHPAQVLPGPTLLHRLLLQSRHSRTDGSSILAIDFLTSEVGVRLALTYQELDQLSTRFAQKLCIQSQDQKIIPILLPQSPQLYVALLGILKAGGAFAPLQMDAPVERIKFVAGDVGAAVIVADPSLAEKVSWEGGPRVVVADESDLDVSAPCDADNESVISIQPTDPAYVMYTSGSTGAPKGVLISHSAVTQSLLAHERHIPAYDRFLQFAAATFDVFVFEVFFTLFRGAALIGCDRSLLITDLVGVINRMEVDAMELTPTVLGELVVSKARVPNVKAILTIGEMLTRNIIDEFGDCLLHGMYGPTEAAIHCTLAMNFQKAGCVGDVGVPLDTVSAFIIGPPAPSGAVEVLPLGWVGELAVGGHQLADSYLHRPELTAAAFVDSPYGRLYRTGDRARMHADGTMECFGRIGSGQVKLRGQRVELGEIEEAIRKAPGVRGVVASVISGSLVVFVGGGAAVTDEGVRDAARKWLPGYMLPNTIAILEEIPRLASGKSDRKQLEKTFLENRHLPQDKDTNAPDSLTETESIIASVVKDVIGSSISKNASFISSGLDSLLSIRACSKLRQLGFSVQTTDILKTDSIEALAKLISLDGIASSGDRASSTGLATEATLEAVFQLGKSRLADVLGQRFSDVEDILPCTVVQEAMLAESMRDPKAYTNWILLEIAPTHTDQEIEAAFHKLIRRNEILRTGFFPLQTSQGAFVQIVWDGPQTPQFVKAGVVEAEHQFIVDEMLTPPLKACLVSEGGLRKLSIHIHHALYDGWAWEQILDEFDSLLRRNWNNIVDKRPSFREVVRYNLSRPQAQIEKCNSFWSRLLAEAPNSKIPNFHGHSNVTAGTAKHAKILHISKSQVEAAARSFSISPQVIFQTAWASLLGTYLNSSDVLFGTVISGRMLPISGIENIIGPCLSTLPVRVNLGTVDLTYLQVMQQIHRLNNDILNHVELDLRAIKKLCTNGTGNFDTLIIWQQTLAGNYRSDTRSVVQIESKDHLEFSLLLEVEPSEVQVTLNTTYKTEIISEEQIELLLCQLDELVTAIITAPESNLTSLLPQLTAPLLSVFEANVPEITLELASSLQSLVENSVSRNPHAIALEFLHTSHGGLSIEKLTYTQLNTAANKLAHKLVAMGVVPNELVCVCMEKSSSLYISILAILKSGGAYVPITSDTPPERIAGVLNEAQIKICLSTSDLRDTLRIPRNVRVVDVDTVNVDMFPGTNPGILVEQSDLAYVVFTSGSTGTPKGVLVTQKSTVNNLLLLKEIYPYSSASKLLQSCSQGFDVSVFEIFWTWMNGMALCSGTKDTLLRDLTGAINEFGITHLSLTPTVAALVDSTRVPTVQFLVTAGEAVTTKVFRDWAGRGLYLGYGPSETTNICTLLPNADAYQNINNLGPPLPNTSAFVLSWDDEFNPVPIGGVGELCWGGVQVAVGYLNLPELNAKRFITHPKYGRIYRSGDLGRMLPNGHCEYLGRLDDQVKIRGLRIELGEINSVLMQHNAVFDCTTLPISSNGSAALQLISFVVLKQFSIDGTKYQPIPATPEVSRVVRALFKTLSAYLAAYMVPSTMIPITCIPGTPQGKVDKKKLEILYQSMDQQSLSLFNEEYIEEEACTADDWTQTETKIAQLIAQVAGVPFSEVGRRTSIFRLGLDSISAIYLSSEIAKLGFQRLDVSQIMRNPNATSLAALVSLSGSVSTPTQAKDELKEFDTTVREGVLRELGLSDVDVTAVLPCTPLQEAMLTERVGDNATSYFNHTVFELRADPHRLKLAWDIAMRRNDILRTCFSVTTHPHHAYAQVVLSQYSLPWTAHTISDDSDLIGQIHDTIAETSVMLKISRPPHAFALFSSPSRHVLLMTTHHSLYDGFAMDLLLEEVRMAYEGIELPSRSPFSDVLQYIETCDLFEADKFWKATLSGFEPSQFPDLTGKSNTQRANLTGMDTRSLKASKSLGAIESGCREQATSLLACGQSAWAQLLSVYTGEKDVCFGNVVSGRTIPVSGVESIIAPCFNTIPVRVQMTSELTKGGLMQNLQSTNLDTMPYQLTPLRRIMTTLRTNGQMFFDTLFILQYSREQVGAVELWKVIEDRGEMDFAVVLEIVPNRRNDELNMVLHYRRNVMSSETAEIILKQLDHTLTSSLANPEDLVSNHSKLEKSLKSISNSPPTTLPEDGDRLLHTLFEEHARNKAHSIALEFLDDSGNLTKWSYETMNSKANQIAHLILSYGSARDEAIPICMEKSPLYYMCVLGVLKAGSAFTPIDPSAPAQRKTFMIAELCAKLVLTNVQSLESLEAEEGVKFIAVDQCLLEEQPTYNPNIADLSPSNLAYRLYTSGSTGVPKAVSLEIKSALQTIRASRSIIPWNNRSRLLQFAAVTFDMCYYDCFMAWNYGFVLCSAGRLQLLGDLEGTIQKLEITMLDLTPTVAATINSSNLPGVELLYCIGEAMPQSVIEDWEKRCVNSYGPTEAAMCCTIVPVDRTVKAANIGKPFSTTSFTILARDAPELLPILGMGELCIGGDQVAREYHNNTKLTEERFITVGSQRLYRTGDNVRMLADQTFEFIGRLDDQVKIRGLRVELDEINNVLKRSHNNIKEVCTAVLRHSAESKEQLVSFIAIEGRRHHGSQPSILQGEIHQEIQLKAKEGAVKALPSYMVPGLIFVIDHIPQSAAGKVDKKSLGSLFSSQKIESLSAEDESNEEWSEVESEARAVLAKIARIPKEKISKSSTIYQLGLDSISAAQVAMGLRAIGFQLTVIDILECPSLNQLSPRLIKASGDTQESATATQVPAYLTSFSERHTSSILSEYNFQSNDIITTYPTTATQSGMLSQFINSNGNLYFNHIVFKLSNGVDIPRLQEAWEQLMSQNDILRAGFVGIDDDQHSFASIIHSTENAKLPWTVIQATSNIQSTVEEQKEAHKIRALGSLHTMPWSLAIITDSSSTILLLSAHHALYDAQSLQMMLDDVIEYYLEGTKSTHNPFVHSLGKMVEASFDEGKLEESRAFWLNQLEGSTISTFPKLTATIVKNTSSHITTHASKWKLSQIENSSKILGFSVNSVAQAAWVRVLAAYLGEPQVTFGSVISGRTGVEQAEEILFPCLTTIPVLGTAVGTNQELVERTQQSNTRVLLHQHTPLRAIQKWFDHPEQSFFDTLFVYQKTGTEGHEGRKSIWEITEENAYVDYPISIEVEPTEDNNLLIRATCRDSFVPKSQSQLIVQQIDAALVDILTNPQTDCTDFSNFDHPLLSITPPAIREIPSKVKLLHQFVEYHCDTIPDTVALEFATSISEERVVKKQWTYKELERESNKVANFLLLQGVKTGNLVAICFEKSAEASFAIIGILKAGCGYVALDPSAPIDRKAFITKDSGARCILTMDSFKQDLQDRVDVGVFAVASDNGIKSASIARPRIFDLQPSSLCYCLYTSGTTGTPKGCELTHENAVQAMLAFQRLFAGRWDSNSRFLQFASFHFDVSVLEQFWSWSVGVCVTSTPRDILFEDLALAIRKLEITHLDLTPSLAALLSPEDVPSLNRGVFIVGGEALKQDVLDTWGPYGVLHNGYGPTEVTIGCTMLPKVPQDGKPSNIGPQFDNVGSFIMTANTDRPTLRGAIGELCVSGKLVGKGYLNRADLTNEKFPYLEKFDERIYRTGDLVRILHNGDFDFSGRADDQVKLRGQRLEIGEINATIKRSHPRVKAVATLVLKHPKQQRDQLISFISFEGSAVEKNIYNLVETGEYSVIIGELLNGCKRHLPVYMVPTHFLPVTNIPLSVNNKVNNKKLAQMYKEISLDVLQALVYREGGAESLSSTALKVRKVLAEMTRLQESEIKNSSTIFELGLDSVSVVSLARRLKKNGFGAVTVSMIMQNSTVEKLGQVLSKDPGKDYNESNRLENTRQQLAAFTSKNSFEISENLGIDQDKIHKILPCTALQEGMILRFIDSDEPLYFVSFTFELSPSTNIETLRGAWAQVVRSTESLRTCFSETADGYAQIVLKDPGMNWENIYLSDDRSLETSLEKEKVKLARLNRTLHKPPIYLRIVRTPTRVIFALQIFHALYDGGSLPLVLKDVEDAYRSNYQPRACQFSEVVPHILSCDLHGAEIFWKKHLEARQFTQFPQRPGSGNKDFSISKTINIDGKRLESGCRTFGCTPQSIIQAAWASVLAYFLGTEVTFGVVVSGRSLPLDNIDETIGPLFNSIPCFLHIGSSTTWKDLVSQAHKFNSESIPYHHTPLRLIRKWLSMAPEKQPFDTLFVYQKNNDDSELDSSIWKTIQASAEVDFPLSVEVEHNANGTLVVSISAKGSVLTEENARKLISEIESTLDKLLKSPDNSPKIIEWSSENAPVAQGQDKSQANESAAGFEWTPEALKIRSTIATLTGLEESQVPEDSSIFELGLDSIEAIKLSARLRRAGVQISVSTIMRNPTIRQLSTVLRQASKGSQKISDDTSLSDFETKSRKKFPVEYFEAIYPTTPLQEAMIAETLNSDYKFYFNHDVLEISDSVDLGRLQRAWKEVTRTNPILRTSFFQVHELGFESPHAFGQAVHKKSELSWKEVSLPSGTDLWDMLRDAMDGATKDTDILERPPLKLTVVKAQSSRYLVLSIHHALYDGWALSLLHEDVQRAYDGKLKKRPSPTLLLENILGNNPEESSRFWKQVLHGAEISEFPLKTRQSEPPTTHRGDVTAKVSRTAATQYCKRLGITLQTLGQTCWGLVLAHYLGKADIIFGTVLSGRDMEGSEEIMFPAMNTVPVRAIAHGSYKEMLRYMQHNSGNVLKHQHTPLRMIQRLVNSDGQRLFDTLFIYQRGNDGAEKREELYQSIMGSSDLEYNVCVEMEREGDRIVWRTACKSTVMSSKQMQGMLDALDSMITHIVENPESPAVTYENDLVRFGNTKGVRPAHRKEKDESTSRSEASSDSGRSDWSEFELKVREVISTVSRIPAEDIERSSTIFHLGLDSISAIRLASELRKKKIFVSVAEILKYATVEKIAFAAEIKNEEKVAVIDTEKALKNALEGIDTVGLLKLKGINQTAVERVMPATAGQVYMLSVWQNTNGGLFMPTFTFKSKRLDHQRLQIAWEQLVQTREILRTTFISTGQEKVPIVQVVFSKPRTDFEWQETASEDQDAIVAVGVAREQQKEVTLKTPPVRLTLLNTPTRSIILFTIHHALYDGVSLPLLLKELQRIYNTIPKSEEVGEVIPSETINVTATTVQQTQLAQSAVEPTEMVILTPPSSTPEDDPEVVDISPSPATPSAALVKKTSPTFADVVGYTCSMDKSKQRDFWTKYLAGVDSTLLAPVGNPLASTPALRTSLFNPALFTKSFVLEERCRKMGISLQALFLAAFSKVYIDVIFPQQSSASNSAASSPMIAPSSDFGDYGDQAHNQDIVIGIYHSNRHLPVAPDSGSLDELAAPTLNLLPLRVRSPRETSLQMLAEKIQKDLGEIGSAEHSAGVGVADIERWTRTAGGKSGTGIKVDAWFNYLKLPGVEMFQENESLSVDEENDDWVGFEEIKPTIVTNATSGPDVHLHSANENMPMRAIGEDMLGTNAVRGNIMTNLDIEIAVSGGNVGVGVFARGDLLHMKEAERLVMRIGEVVDAIL